MILYIFEIIMCIIFCSYFSKLNKQRNEKSILALSIAIVIVVLFNIVINVFKVIYINYIYVEKLNIIFTLNIFERIFTIIIVVLWIILEAYNIRLSNEYKKMIDRHSDENENQLILHKPKYIRMTRTLLAMLLVIGMIQFSFIDYYDSDSETKTTAFSNISNHYSEEINEQESILLLDEIMNLVKNKEMNSFFSEVTSSKDIKLVNCYKATVLTHAEYTLFYLQIIKPHIPLKENIFHNAGYSIGYSEGVYEYIEIEYTFIGRNRVGEHTAIILYGENEDGVLSVRVHDFVKKDTLSIAFMDIITDGYSHKFFYEMIDK